MKADTDRQGLLTFGSSGEKRGFLFGGGFLIAFIVAISEGRMDIVWEEERKQHNCTEVVQIFFQLS